MILQLLSRGRAPSPELYLVLHGPLGSLLNPGAIDCGCPCLCAVLGTLAVALLEPVEVNDAQGS